ncbi:hypothetical protein RSAG8_03190, partial [Rhizoctonia solani AG-8 WAC10335]
MYPLGHTVLASGVWLILDVIHIVDNYATVNVNAYRQQVPSARIPESQKATLVSLPWKKLAIAQ